MILDSVLPSYLSLQFLIFIFDNTQFRHLWLHALHLNGLCSVFREGWCHVVEYLEGKQLVWENLFMVTSLRVTHFASEATPFHRHRIRGSGGAMIPPHFGQQSGRGQKTCPRGSTWSHQNSCMLPEAWLLQWSTSYVSSDITTMAARCSSTENPMIGDKPHPFQEFSIPEVGIWRDDCGQTKLLQICVPI